MFDFLTRSRALGKPLELYRFQVGDLVLRYCDGDDDFVFEGNTYAAVPITRGAISASGTLDRQTLTVTIADTIPLADRLRGYPASAVMTLTLRQGHRDDPDKQFLVAWVGRVLGAQGRPESGTRELTCQPASTSLKRIGLRRNWQFGCPHVLYGDQCRASISAASVTVTPSSATGRVLTLPAGWNGSRPAAKFIGGLAVWGSEVRSIVKVDGATMVLNGPIVPGAVTLSLGCNHLRDDCSTLHVPSDEADYGGGNIRNFGGQPFIPPTNPVGFVSNYS